MSADFAGEWRDLGARPSVDARRAREMREQRALDRLALVARVMDSAFVIPGANIRIGVDPLIGLIPAVGDMIAGAIAAWIVFEARRLGAPVTLVARMVANVVVDTVIGAVPVIGDAFDVAFKANIRNVELLRRHLERRRPTIDGEVVGRG
ncbi:DUF4112 domain-containing protein [Terrarubrum flagellatum]|uniref:DUF4112 domain-containing protein n=1 Tax=Terrirubrum flagellatum TaxID=2895980 RepID=UPI0031451DC7